MPQVQLFLNLPAIEADIVRIANEDYALIKSKELMKLFGPMQRTARQNPPPAATNGQKQPQSAAAEEKPQEAFTELVLMALKDVQPASGSEVFGELSDSGVACDQKKVSSTLTYLKKTGRVSFDPASGKWAC